MKKTNPISSALPFSVALLAATALLSASKKAQAGDVNPADAFSMILVSPTIVPFYSTAFTVLGNILDNKKEALAQVAIEDAAVYYETGKLTGVLPTILEVLRANHEELSALSDAELVDAVVEFAESSENAESQGTK